jgi:D-ribose pyranose/furanose isomerase RbsD
MDEKLKKIKGLIEQSLSDDGKRDFYLGQAVGIVDEILDKGANTPTTISIPDVVLKNTHVDKDQIMSEAVARHKKLHKELNKDSISKQNTQFKKLT